MKKLLSLILATAMVLSLIPATFATGTETDTAENFTIKYDLQTPMGKRGSNTIFAEVFSETNTNGFYSLLSSTKTGSESLYANWLAYTSNKWIRITKRPSGEGNMTFNLNVPVSGEYTMKVNVYSDSESPTLIKYKKGDADWQELGTLNAVTKSGDYYVKNGEENASVYIDANEDFAIGFYGTDDYANSYFGDFYLISGDGNGAVLMPYYNGETTLEVGDTASLKGYKSSDASETAVSYSVTGDAVSVDEETGIITAEKAGTATVTMTATDSSITTAKTYSVDIAVEDAKTDFVSIGIDEDGDGVATIKEAALGDEVTITAADRENMVFRGWVRGSADNGHLVWDKPEHTFTATTHTYLTAIYTEKVEGEANEYYHWNGQFLGNDKTTAEANISPIVGYTFAKSWTEAKKENLITSWIADFTKNNDEYAVTGNGFTMTMDDSKYDTEVTCTANSDVYWYRDGELVDYGTEYKFFIWDNTTVTTSDKGHNGAKLMLDKKKDNTYMVEYDAGDAKLLEVGILFGDTGENPTVESCKEKMSSQRNINEKGHGQFSATSECAVARGYLVYQDGDAYRVIYAD